MDWPQLSHWSLIHGCPNIAVPAHERYATNPHPDWKASRPGARWACQYGEGPPEEMHLVCISCVPCILASVTHTISHPWQMIVVITNEGRTRIEQWRGLPLLADHCGDHPAAVRIRNLYQEMELTYGHMPVVDDQHTDEGPVR